MSVEGDELESNEVDNGREKPVNQLDSRLYLR